MLATVFAALPPALEALLAVVGVFAAVLTIVPALVGFVGLAQHKKLDSIRDDTTYALYASVPAAIVLSIAAYHLPHRNVTMHRRRRPHTADYLCITGIAAVISLLALVAAFGGAGVSAIVALIVLGGPLSFYGNEYLKSHGHVTGHSADTPHAHT